MDILSTLNGYLQSMFKPTDRPTYYAKIIYWINTFQKRFFVEPEQFYFSSQNSKIDLWLFSDKYILRINDFLHDTSSQKDEIEIYPFSQIRGYIKIEFENCYHLDIDPYYGSDSKVRLRFNQLGDPVEIEAVSIDCPQLVNVTNYLLQCIE
jgi:hypothetical protein